MTRRPLPLPLAGAPHRKERADAAKNRERILRAAEAVFAREDPQTVTMEKLARAAGVGRGTLYRRYPSVAAVATALLDEHEQALQEQLMGGDPPLGPGAPPAARLAAFYARMVSLLEDHARVVLSAEPGHARFTSGAYGFWRAHVAALAREARAPRPDVLADILLAPLAAEVYLEQRRRGASPDDITASLQLLASVLPDGKNY